SPLKRLLEDEYQRTQAVLAIRALGIPIPPNFPTPLQTSTKLIPLPQFTRAAAGTGFCDFDIFPDPVLRSLPLFLELDGRLYPQMGLMLACKLIDADLAHMRYSPGTVIIPTKDRGELRIPVREQYSRNLG